MQHKTLHHLLSFALLASSICLLLLANGAQADNKKLLETYEKNQARLQENPYGIPIYVESTDTDNTMHGSVYGIINHPFNNVRLALTTAKTWCDIAPQHFNIKACTYQALDDHCQITFYTGRKFYEAPDEVYQLDYHFQKVAIGETYFQTLLTSADGPMGTRNYRIEAEAIPLSDSSTFIHFSYSYHYNFFTSLGMGTYLATLGRNKVGFSVVNTGQDDEPVYIKGVRGIIERNAVRYYLAIQSYLDTAHLPDTERFKTRIHNSSMKWTKPTT